MLGRLGEGGQAAVWLALIKERYWALKVFEKLNPMSETQAIPSQLEAMFNEIDIYRALNHEHLIQMAGGKYDATFWENNQPR